MSRLQSPEALFGLAYPLSDVAAILARVRHHLLISSLLGFLVALVISALAAHLTARRLQHIVQFADRVAAGDLTARIDQKSGDEIGQVAASLDKTARHLEESFSRCRPASANSKPC